MTAPGSVLVAGTGKMGRNIGLHLARNGWRVAWMGRDAQRMALAERWLGRRLRKLPPEAALGFWLADDPKPLPPVALVIEAIEEDAGRKQELLRRLEARLPTPTPAPRLLSTTSSLLPEALHPRLSVAHFFYPLEYTGLVELVPGPALGPEDAHELAATLEQTGLLVVRQDHRSAFMLNRLLLPLQNACLAALINGMPPEQVDEASAASPLCPVGQLGLMDSVGLDVVAAAVENYLARMEPQEAAAYAPLRRGLARALALGRRGNKSGAGLLCGEPMTWDEQPEPGWSAPEAWSDLMLGACMAAKERGLVDAATLDAALARLFGAEATVGEELMRCISRRMQEGESRSPA